MGRNNQDGWAIRSGGAVTVAVVTDGCSSQPTSEVGAKLGAQFICNWVLREAEHGVDAGLASRALDALVDWLGRTIADVGQAELERSFLFTFLCAVTTPSRALVFGVGDGVVVHDSTVLQLDSGPANAPDYAAYAVLQRPRVAVKVHFEGTAARLIIATDGLGEALAAEPQALGQLFADGAFTNPAAVQRRLNLLCAQCKVADDLTLVALSTPEVRS